MKIGHISINVNTLTDNFGAILHDWAFQKFLKNQGFSHVQLINYVEDKYCCSVYGIKIPFFVFKMFGCVIKRMHFSALIPFLVRHFRLQRFYKMTGFDISWYYYGENDLDIKSIPYDCVICVSDVIWALRNGRFSKPFYLASESMKGKKKIAFVPSMGEINFTDTQQQEQKNLINNIEFVSCRGKFVAEYVSKLTGRDIPALLDPVFLLNRKDYNQIAAKKFYRKPYLLIYEPMQKNEYMLIAAVEFAKRHHLEVIEISVRYNSSRHFPVHLVTMASCEDFLAAIRDADAVFTNSYHMMCFSIIYQKDFYCFTRKYNSKTIDFLDNFGLRDRFITDGNFRELSPIDYKSVYAIMSEQQTKTQNWLLQAIYACEKDVNTNCP